MHRGSLTEEGSTMILLSLPSDGAVRQTIGQGMSSRNIIFLFERFY
jgi:hypothetical protein